VPTKLPIPFLEKASAYGGIMHASVKLSGGGTHYFYADYGWAGSSGFRSLEILQRERLLNIERVKPPASAVEAAYFNLTFLGVSFVLDCSPDAVRMAARRVNPRPSKKGAKAHLRCMGFQEGRSHILSV
jgi:hypothetical protein